MKLWLTDVSGNSYKTRVLTSILNVPCEMIYIDATKFEHKQRPLIDMNPRGQVPVMEIEGKIFWDSTAHLTYIARKYGGDQWLPVEPLAMAEIMQWMALAQNEIYFGLQWARGVFVYGKKGDLGEYQLQGRKALTMLERQLKDHEWLALDHPTIAEIACYPYTKRAPEGEVALEPYPAVQAWLARCESIPGWVKLD